MLEQEVKLEFANVEAARRSIESTGARLVVSRRLLDDQLFDTADQRLRQGGSALRLRRDDTRAIITFKGPVQPGPVKCREEIETDLGDAVIGEALLHALGYRGVFRLQKYREEYTLTGAVVTVDEAPIGVFVEIEATPEEIDRIAALLGKSRADYRLESYAGLYARWCEARGIAATNMVFEHLGPSGGTA